MPNNVPFKGRTPFNKAKDSDNARSGGLFTTVSYTNLTLPTIYSVKI